LHPLVCVIDECQNLFAHDTYGGQAGDDAEFVIKLGRALGVVLILATQRPDRRSLPTGVSANVSIRYCLRVGGQIENDMILGTSAYQNGIRATTFIPETDAGIGYLVGATPQPKIVRTAWLGQPGITQIAARARALREHAGTLTGHADGLDPEPAGPAWDLLADIAAVVSEPKIWSERGHPPGGAAPGRLRPVGRDGARGPGRPAHRRAQAVQDPHRPGLGHHRRRQGRQPARRQPRRHHQGAHRT
jgi:S-DNA-T family DNA segregation ATPase FtsK/SpoIIIE